MLAAWMANQVRIWALAGGVTSYLGGFNGTSESMKIEYVHFLEPVGRILVFIGEPGDIVEYDAQTQQIMRRVKLASRILAASVAQGTRYLIAVPDGTMHLYHLLDEENNSSATLRLCPSVVHRYTQAFTPHGKLMIQLTPEDGVLLSSDETNVVRFWDKNCGSLWGFIRSAGGRVHACALIPSTAPSLLSNTTVHRVALWTALGIELWEVRRSVPDGTMKRTFGPIVSPGSAKNCGRTTPSSTHRRNVSALTRGSIGGATGGNPSASDAVMEILARLLNLIFLSIALSFIPPV
ncbi:hypothetical protein BV20DRAFT_1056887 [Pilatotrama ljubarskyi]|nr:hypothetical protein BV20DRAFT_1056887 [Pilatotrama ljubarskyi]